MPSKFPRRSPSAGGLLIAIGAMAGAVIGLYRHQPTIGFLVGTGLGIALSLVIWLRDRPN